MANFVFTVDPDKGRRSAFIKAIEPRLALVDGLVTGACEHGDFKGVWAAEPRAPVGVEVDGDAVSVLWGEPIDISSASRLSAQDFNRQRRCWDGHAPAACDGFYAAVNYDPASGVMIWADLLGLFPLYYACPGNVLLVGTSPELFRDHPAFRMELDLEGLVGILLTMHLIDGRTLFQDVRRLSAGHALAWRPDKGPRELPQYRLPVSRRLFDLPFSGHVEVLERALTNAVRRHAPPGSQYSLLLSGGRDSRLLAGLLHRNGVSPVSLTLGIPTDFELHCAAPVARALGFEHRTGEIAMDQFLLYAETEATWGHAAYGFNLVPVWGMHRLLRDLPPRVISAYVSDAIIGGSHISWAYSSAKNSMSFDTFFGRINSCGVATPLLRRLLRRPLFDGLVDTVIARIRAAYEGYSDLDSQRAWGFDLNHRQRFHVGSNAWRLAFGAWPILPVVDHEVLEVAGGMPAATLAERRVQDEILCIKFPRLAELPLDRNSTFTEPLRPRLRYLVMRRLQKHLRSLGARRRGRDTARPERRRYYRLYDLNGASWMAVRSEADKYRERVLDVFDADVLDEIVPPAPRLVPFQDGIVDFSGPKSLIGFMLWSRDHL